MRISLACKQPVGVHACYVNQFQYNMGRRCDSGLVVEPGLNPDVEGIGQELGAVFPVEVFANLPEACGQPLPLMTIRVVRFSCFVLRFDRQRAGLET